MLWLLGNCSDLAAIQNALEAYKDGKDNGDMYPIPRPNLDKNLNCYNIDTSYAHDCDASDTAFIQSQIDSTLLTKKYLQEVPTDPRTGSRYSYGVTADGQYYQVAGIIENEDGTFSAKVLSNLHFTYPLRSLIRSYNGLSFVIDGEDYLPYSPYPMVISATLADGTEYGPGDTVKNTSTSDTLTLYFSDGSVTYLDPQTELKILESSAVDQNDSEGIITKIRLKLLQGKVWNKVVRLAGKSEFNIETTSAIAGVRGTEFGIDAAGTQLVVLNGEVAARQIDTANDTYDLHGNVVFDKSDTYFNSTTEIITGTGTLAGYLPGPSGTGPTTGPAPNSADYNKYYLQPYSNNLEPRIDDLDVDNNVLSLTYFEVPAGAHGFLPLERVHAYDADANASLTIWEKSDFAITSENMVSIKDPSSFYTSYAPGRNVIFQYEDSAGNLSAFSTPPIAIQSGLHLTYAMLYGDEVYVAQTGGGGGQVCDGNPFKITITGVSTMEEDTNYAFTAIGDYTSPQNCTQDITDQCTWLASLGDITPSGAYTAPSGSGSATITCELGTSKETTVNIISHLNAVCWGPDLEDDQAGDDDAGYWLAADQSCWVMAAENNPVQSCTYACTTQLNATCEDITGPENWDDNNKNICLALANAPNPPVNDLPISPVPTQGTDAIDTYAPYFKYLNGVFAMCHSRDSGQEPANLCEIIPSATIHHRICRCI